MAPDNSSSSPPTSASTEGESQTHQLFSSQFQLPSSHNNAPSPTMLPPPLLPPSTANSISGWRRTIPRSRKPMATNSHVPQPSGINSLPLPPLDNSHTLHELSPQEKPTNGTHDPRDIDGIHQDPPLPAASTDHESLIELLSGMRQDSHTGQDLPPTFTIPFPVSVVQPHVPHMITHPLRFADSSSDSDGSESVSSNDEEAGHEVNNVPHRMIYTEFPPHDDDPDYDIWVGPPPGYYKLNVATDLCNVAGGPYRLGMGAVIRDHSGVARMAMTLVFNNLNRSLASEYFIYNLGIAFSFYCGFRQLIAETESPWLVGHIRALSQTPRLHYSHFNYFHARRVNRNANNAAHMFASQAAVRGGRNVFWSVQDIINVFGTNVMPF